jgi:diguanylate cyclase (GGDEF)-like protein
VALVTGRIALLAGATRVEVTSAALVPVGDSGAASVTDDGTAGLMAWPDVTSSFGPGLEALRRATRLATDTGTVVRSPGAEGRGWLLAFPLSRASGSVGSLGLAGEEGGGPVGYDESVLRAVAALLAQAFERDAVARRQVAEDNTWAAVRRLLTDGSEATSAEEAGTILARVAAEALHAERAGMYVINPEGVITFAVGVGVSPELSEAVSNAMVGKRAADSPGWRKRGVNMVHDVANVEVRPGGFVETLGVRAYVAVPLLSADGQIGFVICGDTQAPRAWTAQEEALAAQLALEGALVVDHARLRETERRQLAEMRRQAFHDPLTGLPNRALLAERVEQALEAADPEGAGLALLLLDLNDFKQVNDSLGHLYGDMLLQKVGAALGGLARHGDTVARLGGDEFAVLVSDNSRSIGATALAVAERIQRRFEEPFRLAELALRVVPSIGIAFFPDHGRDPSALLQHADTAMYEAKRKQRGAVVYDPARDRSSVDRLTLFSELRHALDRGQLLMRYQPTVDVATGEVVAAEALLRWAHPRRGLLLPEDFLPVAEATGLIDTIGLWALAQAAQDALGWQQAGLEIALAVNVALRNLQDPRFTQMVGQLAGDRAGPNQVVVELTETAVMSDPDRIVALLRAVRDTGARTSVDDFGAGRSSLSLLHRLPVDELKIDRAVVHDMGRGHRRAAVAGALVQMGHHLGLTVTAAGVEDAGTLARARDLGCDHAQGFYLCPPMPAEDLVAEARELTDRLAAMALGDGS